MTTINITRFRLMLALAICGSLIAIAERRGTAVSEAAFDVNDLSLLIPPSEQSIRVGGTDNARAILTRTLFNTFDDFVKRGHPDVDDPYAKLVVTAVRFDPCGPLYPADWDLQKCVLPNLRLIAQVYDSGTLSTAALHMVFTLGVKVDQDRTSMAQGTGFDPEVRARAITEIRAMKARNAAGGIVTAGVPLGIHPAFTPANRNSARGRQFAQELEQFVRGLATEKNYFATAVMFAVNPSTMSHGELDGKERWIWQKADVRRTAAATGQPPPPLALVLSDIPGIGSKMKEQSFTARADRRSDAEVSPASTRVSEDGLRNQALEAILRDVASIEAAKLQRAVDIADRMDNPRESRVQLEDCVSCHLSTTARAPLSEKMGGTRRTHEFDTGVAGLTSISHATASPDGYRVMSFAFFKGDPSISQRTINETLQAARLLNGLHR